MERTVALTVLKDRRSSQTLPPHALYHDHRRKDEITIVKCEARFLHLAYSHAKRVLHFQVLHFQVLDFSGMRRNPLSTFRDISSPFLLQDLQFLPKFPASRRGGSPPI